jgi:predicted nucleotidyltransferase
VEYEPDRQVSLFDLCRLENLLSDRLGLDVQVLKSPIKRTALKMAVETDAVPVL